MKIEKINENQIKCTLTRSDLASRQLKMSELAYGTEKANSLFQDMMDQANTEFGFNAADDPLMIEAIPVSMDCIILMITRVDDPSQVEPRYNNLSSLRNIFRKDSDDDFLQSALDMPEEMFPAAPDFIRESPRTAAPSNECVFSFKELTDVIDFAGRIKDLSLESSSLYKSNENGRYYLLMHAAADKAADFARICSSALEFAVQEPAGYSRIAYMNEHFETIIDGDAVDSLAYV